jgi:hypothetical protein
MTKPITASQLAKAQAIVNEWFDKRNNFFGDPDLAQFSGWLNQPGYFPDGHPTLMEIDGHPVLSFEGCAIDEWAMTITDDIQSKLDKIGVFAEPYYSFALGLYRA